MSERVPERSEISSEYKWSVEDIYKSDDLWEADYKKAQSYAEKIGSSSVILGAGRKTKEDKIDHAAGIILKKKTGDKVQKGEVLAELFSNNESLFDESEKLLLSAYEFSSAEPKKTPLIYETVR